MNNYKKGANWERAVKKYFEEQYTTAYVVRSAGSKGAIDLVVLKKGNYAPLLVQVKLDGKISDVDKEDLCWIASVSKSTPVLAWKDKYGKVDWKILYPNTKGEN